jgi:hypothetical protein
LPRKRRVFTFSNAVALLALFLALGGTVYAAGKISGSQIKPHSITGKQIKSGSLTGKQVVGKSLNGVSASSLGSVVYATTAVTLIENAKGGTSGTASCPAGTKVVGGGAIVSDEQEDYVNDSGPAADRGGWAATGFSGASGTTMTITAICTAVTSTTG